MVRLSDEEVFERQLKLIAADVISRPTPPNPPFKMRLNVERAAKCLYGFHYIAEVKGSTAPDFYIGLVKQPGESDGAIIRKLNGAPQVLARYEMQPMRGAGAWHTLDHSCYFEYNLEYEGIVFNVDTRPWTAVSKIKLDRCLPTCEAWLVDGHHDFTSDIEVLHPEETENFFD